MCDGSPPSQVVSTRMTTSWERSAWNVFTCSRPRRVVAGQLMLRCRSPGTYSRTPPNSAALARGARRVLAEPLRQAAEDDPGPLGHGPRIAVHRGQADHRTAFRQPPPVAQGELYRADPPPPPAGGQEGQPDRCPAPPGCRPRVCRTPGRTAVSGCAGGSGGDRGGGLWRDRVRRVQQRGHGVLPGIAAPRPSRRLARPSIIRVALSPAVAWTRAGRARRQAASSSRAGAATPGELAAPGGHGDDQAGQGQGEQPPGVRRQGPPQPHHRCLTRAQRRPGGGGGPAAAGPGGVAGLRGRLRAGQARAAAGSVCGVGTVLSRVAPRHPA